MQTFDQPSSPTPQASDRVSLIPTSSYGNPHNTCVQVTTKCGLTLEADAVIVTVPLALVAIPADSPGHIAFSPSLQKKEKRNKSIGSWCLQQMLHVISQKLLEQHFLAKFIRQIG